MTEDTTKKPTMAEALDNWNNTEGISEVPTTKKLAIKAFRRLPLARPDDGTSLADYRLKAWDAWLDNLADTGIIKPEQAKRWKRPDPWTDKRKEPGQAIPTGPGIFPQKKPIPFLPT